jgi:hypothetical protein
VWHCASPYSFNTIVLNTVVALMFGVSYLGMCGDFIDDF